MRLLLGDFGTGKSSYIIQETLKLIKKNKTIWIIVPSRQHKDQLYSRLLTQNHGLVGNPIITLTDLQKILLNIVFPDPISKPKTINNFEKFLIISNIIHNNSKKFISFNNIQQRPEIIKILYRLIHSLQEKNINDIKYTIELKDKIHDLKLIFNSYKKILKTQNISDHTYEINLICQDLNQDLFSKDTSIIPEYIFVDGFVDFTPTQFKLITFFIKNLPSSKEVLFSLVDNPHTICQDTISEFKKNFPNIEIKKFASLPKSTQLANSYLKNTTNINNNLQLYEIQAFGKYKEVEEIINQIKKLCLYEDYKLSDILIINNQQDRYSPLISSLFNKVNIPYTFSKDLPLIQNPLIIFIQKCLHLMQSSLNHESLEFFTHSNYVKSDLRILFEKAPELLTIAINGKKQEWQQGFSLQEKINTNKEYINSEEFTQFQNTILELCDKLFLEFPNKKQAISVYINHLLNLLEFLGLKDTLDQNYHSTYYKKIIIDSLSRDYSALSKFKEILQNLKKSLDNIHDNHLTFTKFLFFLNNIIDETRYRSSIPKINVLKILSSEDARGIFAKAVFILGMNEGEFPIIPKYELFDNQDRHNLNNLSKKVLGQALWQTDIEYFSKEKLSFIVALTRATHKIFFSRTPANEKGNYFGISYFLQGILEYNSFTRIPETYQLITKAHWDNPNIFNIHEKLSHYYEYKYISAPNLPKNNAVQIKQGIQYLSLIDKANTYFDNNQLPPEEALKYFGYIPELLSIINRYQNPEVKISPTGLEKLGRCRYQGLWQEFWKLKTYKLPEYKPEAADYGNLYHYVLELYIKETKDLNDQEFYNKDLLKDILNEYIKLSPQGKVFQFDYEYIFTMLSLFLKNIEIDFREDQEALYFELKSGNAIIPNKHIPLNSTKSLIVNSRIDRINRNKIQEGYSIIDYKKTGSTYKEYQKTPFNLFQGFLYAALLKVNGKTPINNISYIFLEKQEIFNEYPNIKKNKVLYQSIEEFYQFKSIEILQLLTLLSKGNFSPFTLESDIGQEVKELFIDKFGENFSHEYQNKCSYCELKRLCLRKSKKLRSF